MVPFTRSRGMAPLASPVSKAEEAKRHGSIENTQHREAHVRKKEVVISSLLSDSGRELLRRKTLRHVKVKGLHQIKDCLKSDLPQLYAHHLSCCQ